VAVSSVARPKFFVCMDDKPVEQLKINVLGLSGRGAPVKVFTCNSKGKARPRSRRTKYGFARRSDFAKYLSYVGEQKASDLDQLRDDLQEAIERVVRVHGAFIKSPNDCAVRSERVKHIINVVGQVPFHCERQRQIVDKSIKEILEINDSRAKQACDAAEEASVAAKETSLLLG
jgi:hypothetical protein